VEKKTMFTKFNVQICKAVYGGLLPVLVFAVFSASNVPVARAQEVVEETPTVTPDPAEIATATPQTITLSPPENFTATPFSATLSPSETATQIPVSITELPTSTFKPNTNDSIEHTLPE